MVKENHFQIAAFIAVLEIFLFAAIPTVQAQPANRWKTYPVRMTIDQLQQDGNGYIWLSYLRRFDGFDFKNFKEDHSDSLGLQISPDGTLYALDDRGGLWLNGLWRENDLTQFDFRKDGFVQYPLWPKPFAVRSLLYDKQNLWVGTRGQGLLYFNPESGSILKYFNTGSDSLNSNDRNYYFKLADRGKYLLCDTRDGVWKFHKASQTFTRVPLDTTDTAIFHGQTLGHLIFPHEDHHWFVWSIVTKAGDQSMAFVKTDTAFSVTDKFSVPFEINNGYNNIADQDNQGIFWVATENKGMLRVDPATKKFTLYSNEPGNPESLPDNTINNLIVDRDQNVWVGNPHRLNQLLKPRAEFHHYRIESSSLLENGAGTQTVDRLTLLNGTNGHYLVAFSGKELCQAKITNTDLASLKFEIIPIKDWSPRYGAIRSIAKGKNSVWVNTTTGQFIKLPIDPQNGKVEGRISLELDDDVISQGVIMSMQVDEDENLWVSHWGTSKQRKVLDKVVFGANGNVDTVFHYRHEPGNPNSISPGGVQACVQGKKDSIWVATEKYVDLFHNGRFQNIFTTESEVAWMSMFSDGTLLIGTLGDGLFEGRREGDHFTIKKVEALGDNSITNIVEDPIGRLWIQTHEPGLICYNRKDQTIRYFNKDDGFELSSFFSTSDNSIMAFSAKNSLIVFDPLSYKPSETKPHPLLTRLTVNNRPAKVLGHTATEEDFIIPENIGLLSELVLDHSHNFFSLDFNAMEMTAPEKNLYSYKLEGFKEDWTQTDWKNRTASYMNLETGHYTFRVKATNSDGIWSENETTLAITVLPPPWKTWWAYTGYLVLVAGGLVLARRIVVQRERLKANLKLEHVEREKEHFELEKAKEVDRIKTSFFTNISHEFRTPLTLIKGPVQQLLEEFADHPKVKDRLTLILRNSDVMLKLINQLLDLAKLEKGALKVERSKGDISSFISAVTSSFASFAIQKNIAIITDLPTERFIALFDKDKLETILLNLINNAIKFTHTGGKVSIYAEVVTSDKKVEGINLMTQGRKDTLILRVSDTGIGVPEDQQEKIFERFHQVSEAHTKEGTGIGLSLVKELVLLLEGKITVVSKPGEGSEFRVSLPLEIVRLESVEEQAILNNTLYSEPTETEFKNGDSQPPAEIDNQTKPHVLVVEDNPDLRAFIIDSLGNEFHFLEGEDGKQGLEIATREVPDLIISDVMMPEMDGITMAGKIRKDIRTSHIPLILLTAKSTEDSKLSGLESGADDYLTKPFNKNELLLKVRNGISIRAKLWVRLRAELMTTAPREEVQSENQMFLSDVKERIMKRLSDDKLSVESLAEEIGLSRVQLYRKISALTGLSVNEFIRKLRLHRAAQLLEQNWGPVSQIAYEVGFSYTSYFSKVFKEEFGVLPSEYGNNPDHEKGL